MKKILSDKYMLLQMLDIFAANLGSIADYRRLVLTIVEDTLDIHNEAIREFEIQSCKACAAKYALDIVPRGDTYRYSLPASNRFGDVRSGMFRVSHKSFFFEGVLEYTAIMQALSSREYAETLIDALYNRYDTDKIEIVLLG